MGCYVCGCEQYDVRKGQIRDLEGVEIHECANCGLTYLESSRHISSAHYTESPIVGPLHPSVDDWLKSTSVDDGRRFKEYAESLAGKKVLDFGCGAGGFLNRCKEIALVADGVEPDGDVRDYWREKIEIWPDLSEVPGKKYDIITLFHVLEHLHDPRLILRQIADKLESGGSIIVEVPSCDDALITLYDSEEFQDFTYWSQHLYLFNANSLGLLAKQSGLKVRATRYYQRYPLSNHMYWLSRGLPGGHQQWGFLDSEDMQRAYSNALARIGKTDTIICYLERYDE